MSRPFHLQVLSPSGPLLEVGTESVELPVTDGWLGVMAGHAPMIAALRAGSLRYRVGDKWTEFAIPGGTMEVSDDRLLVLTLAE